MIVLRPKARKAQLLVNVTTVGRRDFGRGEAIPGHPLNALLWLIEDLKKSGKRLKEADLLSLGSFSKQQTPQPGTSATLVYEGLPGMQGVSMHFR